MQENLKNTKAPFHYCRQLASIVVKNPEQTGKAVKTDAGKPL
jgi:hypothetical protein